MAEQLPDSPDAAKQALEQMGNYAAWEQMLVGANVEQHWIRAFEAMWIHKNKPAADNPTFKGMQAILGAYFASRSSRIK